MNLRILKKLSKRAAPMLHDLGDHREQFPADRYDSYTGLLIKCRKHYERIRSPHASIIHEAEIKRPAADGNGFVGIYPPHHPREGTIMVGSMVGYYEPEWDEETAWEALCNIVFGHFTDWGPERPSLTRSLQYPSQVFAAAREIAAEVSP